MTTKTDDATIGFPLCFPGHRFGVSCGADGPSLGLYKLLVNTDQGLMPRPEAGLDLLQLPGDDDPDVRDVACVPLAIRHTRLTMPILDEIMEERWSGAACFARNTSAAFRLSISTGGERWGKFSRFHSLHAHALPAPMARSSVAPYMIAELPGAAKAPNSNCEHGA